jgi:tellurite resistance protein TerC
VDVPVWYWVAFGTFVFVMLTLDLFVFHRKSHDPSLRESAWWTAFWCSLALMFNGWVWYAKGGDAAVNFLTGYLVEWALSVDNVFVFAVIFSYFRVPLKYQYRVLFWGILGAIVMRLVFIFAGKAILHYAEWMMPVFGVFLIYTGIKLAFKEDEEVHPDQNWLMKFGRKMFKVSSEPHGDKFFVIIDGVRHVTPLFLVLLVVESTDVMFAVDSVPAILAITDDTFIVFTSNIFAIMGLRALYFLLAGVMDMFKFLNYGLSAILAFVGAKMILDYASKSQLWEKLFGYMLGEKEKLISPVVSLCVVIGLLALSIGASILWGKEDPSLAEKEHAEAALPESAESKTEQH